MKAEKITDTDLARLANRDRSTITKLRLGTAFPSLELAMTIADLSGNRVPVTAYPKPERRRAGASV